MRQRLKLRLEGLNQDHLNDLGDPDGRQLNGLEALVKRVVQLQTVIQDISATQFRRQTCPLE